MCKRNVALIVTFFCAFGWVCDDPAIGAESAPAGNKGESASARNVQVSQYDTVSLNVQNAELASVLQLLSIQGKRNIVPSPKVAGMVTANLYDVTFHEALESILQQNGAGYVEKGNFIYIYTVDELKKIQDASRKVTHRAFRLNYLTAQDASTFVKPLLSTAGSIAISGAVSAGINPTDSDAGANTFAQVETMLVNDYPENIEEIAKVVKALDTRPSQVLVEATILQADLTEDLAFGVDLSILANMDFLTAGITSPLTAVNNMISGTVKEKPTSAINTTVGNTSAGKAGVKIGILTDSVAAFIRALDQVTDTVILANPKLMTLNRQKASVLVGAKVAYLSTTATSTATTQTVEFLDTGTKLQFRPFVSDEGLIRLELKPSISDFKLRESGDVTLPDENTQELVTNVMVPDGQTIVLGGLFKEQTTINRNQVPGLGDIPLVGNAFKGRDDSVRRTEVIFLITPHIVKDKGLAAAAKVAAQGIEMTRVGQHDVVLPWSRSKLSAGHVRDALKQMEANNADKALWEADKALGLDPGANEARRLREKLAGERTYLPGRSLLDDAVDQLVKEQTGHRKDRGTRQSPNPEPALPQSSAGEPAVKVADGTPETPVQTAPAKPEVTAQRTESTAPAPADDAVKIMPALDRAAPTAPAPDPAPQTDKPATETKNEPAAKPEADTHGAEAEKKDQPAAPSAAETPSKPAEEPNAPASQAEPAESKVEDAPKTEQKPKEQAKPIDAQTQNILKDFGAGK